MKHLITCFTTALIISCSFTNSFAGNICYGKGDIFQENRFSHCEKGDVITVHTILADSFKTLAHTKNGSMMIDEMKSNCSFEMSIVQVGSTEIHFSGHIEPITIFNCVYIGHKRNPSFGKK